MAFNTQLPLVSVIVPVHNGQDFLENCINCVLGQTYEAVEVILIDDGSTDRTQAICQKLSAEHENVSVVTLDGRGVSAARNAGLDRALGEYVAFVDADDRIHPRMLEVLYRNLIRSGSDIAGCGFFEWSREEEWESGLRRTEERQENEAEPSEMQDGVLEEDRVPDGTELLTPAQFMMRGILGNDTRCWSKLYRKDVIGTVRFREGLTIGEDMLFLVDLLAHVRRLVSVDFQGYGYYRNPQGAMNRSFQPAYMDQIRCWEIVGELLTEAAAQAEGAAGAEKSGTEKKAAAKEMLTQEDQSAMLGIAAARLLTAAMLTVGKLAQLPAKQRRENRKYLKQCWQTVKQNRGKYGAGSYLDRGYQMKILLFSWWPGLYVRLYGGIKRWSRGF